MTTVAILQPTYLPWLGYFDLIDQADQLILLDTVSVDRKSWQTRNRILARDGKTVWMSVPTHAHQGQLLKDVEIAIGQHWENRHRRIISNAYNHLDHYPTLEPILDCLTPWRFLVDLTGRLIRTTCEILGITTKIINASTYSLIYRDDPIRRITDLCREAHATELLDTAGAKDVLRIDALQNGIPIRYHQYQHPIYTQNGQPFISHLSIADCLARHGPDETLGLVRSGRTPA